MRLATIRVQGGTAAAVVTGDGYRVINGVADVGLLLAEPDWQAVAAAADGPVFAPDDVGLAPVVPAPAKVVCTGLNYRSHILEMGRELPQFPTLFAKFASTLTGPTDTIPAPTDAEDRCIDWEGELAVIVGTRGRRITIEDAGRHIAGYTVANDVSMRSWQNRTNEWLQGKAWDATTPLGPVLVTPDEFDYRAAVLSTSVAGEVVQEHALRDLLFGPEQLVSYVSTFTELCPGDVILTGTPGGVGHARRPPRYLGVGDTVAVTITGLGTVSNLVVSCV